MMTVMTIRTRLTSPYGILDVIDGGVLPTIQDMLPQTGPQADHTTGMITHETGAHAMARVTASLAGMPGGVGTVQGQCQRVDTSPATGQITGRSCKATGDQGLLLGVQRTDQAASSFTPARHSLENKV